MSRNVDRSTTATGCEVDEPVADVDNVLQFAQQSLGAIVPGRTGTPQAGTPQAGMSLVRTPRTGISRVGIETEWFVVDLATPMRAVPASQTRSALAGLATRWAAGVAAAPGDTTGGGGDPVLPGGSKMTFEPGGQFELSGPPLPLDSAVSATASDIDLVRVALADAGLALAAMGTDPLRPPSRTLTASRYVAMERFFLAGGFRAGPVMMCSTASVQVNVDLGGPADRVARWQLAHALGPVLTAMFAASPMLAGRRTGWVSTRQAVWADIDPTRTRPVRLDARSAVAGDLVDDVVSGVSNASDAAHGRPEADAAELCRAWADYLMDARVMLIRDADGQCQPGPGGVTFGDWISGRADFGRLPTVSDLYYHATTVFPPVRPRGWLELRYLDAQPFGLWPVAVAMAVALMDDPLAARGAAEACRPAADRWTAAALLGLRDPVLHRAALVLAPLARDGAARLGAGPELLAAIDLFTERYVTPGRCPADELIGRLAQLGPTGLLRQEATPCVPSLS